MLLGLLIRVLSVKVLFGVLLGLILWILCVMLFMM